MQLVLVIVCTKKMAANAYLLFFSFSVLPDKIRQPLEIK
jgi:hypothetical protein